MFDELIKSNLEGKSYLADNYSFVTGEGIGIGTLHTEVNRRTEHLRADDVLPESARDKYGNNYLIFDFCNTYSQTREKEIHHEEVVRKVEGKRKRESQETHVF
jgi:hypothetical protein